MLPNRAVFVFSLLAALVVSLPAHAVWPFRPSLCTLMWRYQGFTVTSAELALAKQPLKLKESELLARIAPDKHDPAFVEIGPADAPLCPNCLLVEANPEFALETKQAVERAKGQGKVVVGRAGALDLAPGSVSSIVAKHFPTFINRSVGQGGVVGPILPGLIATRDAVLRDFYRVLKPGGAAYLLVSSRNFMNFGKERREFKDNATLVAHMFSDVIRQGRNTGFKVRIVVAEDHIGIELQK